MPQGVNLPNGLTVLRIVLTPVLLGVMIYGRMKDAFWLFLVGSISDALDGMMARLLHQKTELGRFLDPAADKIFLSTSLLTLSVMGKLPVWIAIALVSRDAIIVFGIVVLRLVDAPIPINPNAWGKIATTFEMVYVFFVLLNLAGYFNLIQLDVLGSISVVFSIISGFYYVYNGFIWYHELKG